MPLTPPPDPPARGRPGPPAGPRRRSMVAGPLGALGTFGVLAPLATGCSGDDGGAEDERSAEQDKRLRREASGQSLDLLARYDATADAHSGLADRLRPLRAATMRHAEVLDGRDGDDGKGGAEAGERGESRKRTGQDRRRRPEVPGEEKAALAALDGAERRTAKARAAALVKAPPETARLLASLAAAGATHSYLLGTDGGVDGGAEDGAGDGKDDGS